MKPYYSLFSRRLKKVKRSSDGNYTACCPFHEDQRPSFSFHAETGLWHCFAGCGGGNARQFLERLGVSEHQIVRELRECGESPPQRAAAVDKWRASLLKSEDRLRGAAGRVREISSEAGGPEPGEACAAETSPAEPVPPSPPKGYELVQTYTYTDLMGNILYLKDRYRKQDDPSVKTFRIRWCSEKKRLVLYGLGQLRDDIERIILVEGEKCAEAVTQALSDADTATAVLGYTVPEREFEASGCEELVRGRRIYIIADNDQPGSAKAKEAIQVLKPYASAVYFYDFAGKEEGYDIADYLDEGGDLYHVLQSASKVYERPLLEIALPDILHYPVEAIRYTKSFHIPVGVVGLLAGTGGVGKSYVSLLMMSMLAAQEGIPCLYISLEDPRQVIMLRLQSILPRLALPDLPATKIGIIDRVAPEDLVSMIEEGLGHMGYKFVFLDPIGALFDDENNNAEVQRFMRVLNELSSEHQANIMLVHHVRKFEVQSDDREMLYSAVRGASAFVNNARLAWVLRRMKVKRETVPNMLQMVGVKSNYGRQYDYVIRNLFPDESSLGVKVIQIQQIDPFSSSDGVESRGNGRGDDEPFILGEVGVGSGFIHRDSAETDTH